jgi:hypothetical protein
VPEFIPNIQPNPEPVTPKTKGPNMENEMNHPNSRLPPTPGELALAALMAGARDLQPVDPAAAERAYVTTVAWVSDHADTFSHAGLAAEVVSGGAKIKCRACDRQWFLPTGTDLAPAVLTCQGGCNRYSADPDQGMRRGVRP